MAVFDKILRIDADGYLLNAREAEYLAARRCCCGQGAGQARLVDLVRCVK